MAILQKAVPLAILVATAPYKPSKARLKRDKQKRNQQSISNALHGQVGGLHLANGLGVKQKYQYSRCRQY